MITLMNKIAVGNGFSWIYSHFSIYKDTFPFYKDTKCVKKHAILMPGYNIAVYVI
jgi:hypothetical protein